MDINGNISNMEGSGLSQPFNLCAPKPKTHKTCDKALCESHRNKIIIVAIGVLIGFVLCMGYIVWTMAQKIIVKDVAPQESYIVDQDNKTNEELLFLSSTPNYDVNHKSVNDIDGQLPNDQNTVLLPTRRRSLYVGVLTLEPYLDSRATACNDTWGQSDKIDKLEFYAEVGDSRSHSTIGLVDIPDSSSVDAWHTEKAFKMLEHMCRDHGNQYDWFLRAVDDTYVNVDRLADFLDRLDKTKKLLFGHPTLPIDDTSYKALNGRGYCLGGPGLIFSRPLLQSLCPNLGGCRQKMSHLPADVAIAKCASETVGVECAFVPELHSYFVHSFEKNQFHLLDEFTNNQLAFTYHPLKSTWMMRSLHEHVTRNKMEEAVVQLDDLQMTQVQLKKEMTNTVNDVVHTNQDMFTREVQTSFMTRGGQSLTAAGCSPSYHLAKEETEEITAAVRFAKTSIQWGLFQSCHDVLSAYKSDTQASNVIIIDMICNKMSHPSELSLARAVMNKELGAPYLKEHRTWKTSKHLIIIIETGINDPLLVEFILKLYHLSKKTEQKLILSIIENPGKGTKTTDTSRNNEGRRDYLLKDLRQWYNNANIELHIHHKHQHSSKSKSVVYSDVAFKLSRLYPDATVLFTSIDLQFDEVFLHRCGTIVRQGRQVYSPHPMQEILIDKHQSRFTDENNIINMMALGKEKPLCVHIKDFIPERQSKRKRRNRQHGTNKEPLSVNTALDVNLHVLMPPY